MLGTFHNMNLIIFYFCLFMNLNSFMKDNQFNTNYVSPLLFHFFLMYKLLHMS